MMKLFSMHRNLCFHNLQSTNTNRLIQFTIPVSINNMHTLCAAAALQTAKDTPRMALAPRLPATKLFMCIYLFPYIYPSISIQSMTRTNRESQSIHVYLFITCCPPQWCIITINTVSQLSVHKIINTSIKLMNKYAQTYHG